MAAANSLATVTKHEIYSSGLNSGMWKHFGFYEDRKGNDKTSSVCKVCTNRIKHSANT